MAGSFIKGDKRKMLTWFNACGKYYPDTSTVEEKVRGVFEDVLAEFKKARDEAAKEDFSGHGAIWRCEYEGEGEFRIIEARGKKKKPRGCK